MRMRGVPATVIALIAISAIPVLAHHSVGGYDSTRPRTIRGILTEIEWKNPHMWVLMDVKQPDGKIVNWHIEFAAPNTLYRLGLRPEMFDLKSTFTFEIWPIRDGSPSATGRTVTLPDGRQFDIHDIWGDHPVNR